MVRMVAWSRRDGNTIFFNWENREIPVAQLILFTYDRAVVHNFKIVYKTPFKHISSDLN